MKKFSFVVLALFILVGCGRSKPQGSVLKILSPAGAPALSTLPLFNEKKYEVEITSGADLVQAALVNPNSEYDAIIAPINLGVNLLSKDKTKYKLHSIVTWGNLYLLGYEGTLEKATFNLAGFGEMAIVGSVLKEVVADSSLAKADLLWFSAVPEAQTALLTGEVDMAMIAMPAASATLAKAKEMNKDIKIMFNVQNLYKAKTGHDNFPQAALFVKEESYLSHKEAIEAMVTTMYAYVKNPEQLKEKIDAIGADKLGIPNSDLIEATYDKLALHIVKAETISKSLTDFLKTLNLTLLPEHIIK